MARTTKPLNNTQINQAKPKDKPYSLFDGGGLYLRIKPNGSKIWQFDYQRPYTKTRTTLSFSLYPSISLADARVKREESKALLAQDIDPKEHRDTLKRANELACNNTLEHIAAQWLDVKKASVSADHATDIWRSLELHIFPYLGNVPIHNINAVKTIEIIKPLAAKGSLETVRRLCQRLNEVMTFAVNTGLITANPLSGISKAFHNPVKQHQPTITPEELPELMRNLSLASIKLTTRCLIEWQLHTMVRPSEAAGARWEEIDFDQCLWTIPKERMKKSKEHKVRKKYTVPLSPQCIKLLELIKPISGHTEYVFVSDRDPNKPTNEQTANVALKRMGYHKKLVSHGLRSIASTTLNEQGFDSDTIEAALAHIGKNEVRNAYNRAQYIKRRMPLMNWWSEHIEQAAYGAISLTGTKSLKLVSG
jgi:integrase